MIAWLRAMISDLKSLVYPLGETEFLALLRERKLTFLPGCGSSRFETLLTWETLNHLIDSSTFPLDALRVSRESGLIPTNFYVRQGRVDPAALSKLLYRGVSLIFNRLDEYVPALRALCKQLARDTSERIGAAAIMTSGRGGALKCHYDPEDLIILQIAGTKRWQVFNSPIVNPVPGLAAGSPPEDPPAFDRVLQPGDFLFLPAGHWHHCENGPHRSLHVNILFVPPNGRQLISALVSQLSSDETFSRPLTRHSRPEALAEHETALKARLVDAIQAISLNRFLMEHAARRPAEGVQLEGGADQAHDVQA
jgi:ribosomal protein L16 Arg81 hydroxylase